MEIELILVSLILVSFNILILNDNNHFISDLHFHINLNICSYLKSSFEFSCADLILLV